MIEMRWLTRPIDYTGRMQYHAPDEETVLQFRQSVGVQSNAYGEPIAYQWSEWQDVPKISAASTRSQGR